MFVCLFAFGVVVEHVAWIFLCVGCFLVDDGDCCCVVWARGMSFVSVCFCGMTRFVVMSKSKAILDGVPSIHQQQTIFT